MSRSYFPVLGVAAAFGRTIGPDDDRPGAPSNVAVLSHAYWERAYAGDRGVLGKIIRVANVPCTIIGVAGAEFFGVTVGDAADVWVPIQLLPSIFPNQPWFDSHNHYLEVLGRLRPGVSVERAAAALTPIAIGIDLAFARPNMPAWMRDEIGKQKMKLTPAANGISYLRARFSKPLRVVFAMVGIGLLLACINVMGLGFARAAGRRRELSVRLAIGTRRARIVRQLVTEAAVAALAGGALGLAICRPAALALSSVIYQAEAPLSLDLPIDRGMLLFVLGVSMVAALICGVGACAACDGREDGGQPATGPPRVHA